MTTEVAAAAQLNLAAYAYAVETTGFAILPAQVAPEDLEAMRPLTDAALSATRAWLDSGHKLTATYSTPDYDGCRCMYAWGEPFARLLEHDAIHALASRLMGRYRLWDLIALSARPIGPEPGAFHRHWHRDFDGLAWGAALAGYLWFFVCLDDLTADNGATWVLPGSHRRATLPPNLSDEDVVTLGCAVQVRAKAGDLMVLNPTCLHSVGRNRTRSPRRLVNVSLCHADLPPVLDHWAIAGPALRRDAGERARTLLTPPPPLASTWDVLPPGHPPAPERP